VRRPSAPSIGSQNLVHVDIETSCTHFPRYGLLVCFHTAPVAGAVSRTVPGSLRARLQKQVDVLASLGLMDVPPINLKPRLWVGP